MSAQVGIIMGSQSDWETMKPAADTLDLLGVPHRVEIVSAHRTPEKARQYALSARERGIEVIVAAAGGAAHLPGVLASWTTLPFVARETTSESPLGSSRITIPALEFTRASTGVGDGVRVLVGVRVAVAVSVGVRVAVGGIGSVFGVIVATVILTLMPEFFRFISDYKLLVYGALLFAVMRFAPEGLAGLAGRVFARTKRKARLEDEAT